MRVFLSVLFVVGTLLVSSQAPAQLPQSTVQLPTFHAFSVNTSVLAPDRGGAFLGGTSGSYQRTLGRSVPGAGKFPLGGRPFGSRGFASGLGGQSVTTHVTILDPRELEPSVENVGRATTTTGLARQAARYGANWAEGTGRYLNQESTVARIRAVQQGHSLRP